MLYDLNIPWSPTTSPQDLDRTLSFAHHLGYSVVALNHTLPPPIPASIPNPLPLLPPSPGRPTVLRRATIPISDPSTNHRLPQVAAAYDLVALRPTTERAFLAACTSLSSDNFALISLDLTAFYPFHFPPRTCMAAVSRGLRFEICYGQFLGAKKDDSRARSNFLSNVAGLIRATKGRGLVVSSEAGSALGLRGPADVVNLLAVWGLGTERGKAAMTENARGVVVNEGIRRRGFRGVVDVLGGAEGEEEREKTEVEGAGKKEKGKGKQKGQGKDKGQQQGQKRRSEEGEVAGGVEAPVSKRQAKKMKLAAQKGKPTEA
ncbi:PHP domain-like protein [Coniochaeta ligniaria NRRL 30616]|uniref:PHP domain-like protein n=1 Tax=Coniochaeta ligniaria NRRL 30616 TaxID=1408157 RepID=A0A1J7J9P2_9PEZI|nr:PHP domain-like protein [Coniochaeta ligniaria NRRL 30616]